MEKMDKRDIEVVIFDYGNTLIELSSKQVVLLNDALFDLVTSFFGPCDRESFTAIRKRQILAPYASEEFIENDREGICIELIEELFSVVPSAGQVEAMLELKEKIFVDVVELPDFVIPLLERLNEKYRLAFISNYPCRASVVNSLKKCQIFDMFESIVVSGEIGRVKPHPDIFRKCLDELGVNPEVCVYVGDNWLADIQGAKRLGMHAVHTTQYVSYEQFEPYDGDYPPDAVIEHLLDLDGVLLK